MSDAQKVVEDWRERIKPALAVRPEAIYSIERAVTTEELRART